MKKIFADDKKRNNIIFGFLWAILAVGLFLTWYAHWCKTYNTSLLAISYKYGFTSRGLIGTIYQTLGSFLGVDIWTYGAAKNFYLLCTAIFFGLFAAVMVIALRKTGQSEKKIMQYLILLLTIFTVPTFACEFNFGRIDIFMLASSLAAILLLLIEKAEWLVIPLSACGVMFHQGYVFMFYNIVLVILFVKIIDSDKNKKRKYIIIMVLSILICCALFIWFQIIFRGGAQEYFDEILENAKLVGRNGKAHTDLIRAEIRGIDLTEEERKYRHCNVEEIIAWIVLMCPYIFIVARTFISLIKKQKMFWHKMKYLALGIGSLTMLPDFLFKVDFGRWTYAVVCYYMLVFIVMIALRDKDFIEEVHRDVSTVRGKVFTPFLFAYPMLFVPFNDIVISELVDRVCILVRNIF